MRLSVLFSDALNALKRNKKRSILTMLGIIIGIGAVIAIISIGQGFENYVVDSLTNDETKELSTTIRFQANDSSLYNDANIDFFSNYDMKNIEAIKGVSRTELMEGSVLGKDASLEIKTNEFSNSVATKFDKFSKEDIIYGRNLNSVDNNKNSRVIIISEQLSEKLFSNTKDTTGKTVEIMGLNYNIVGVYKNTMSSMESMYDLHMAESTHEFYNKNNMKSSILTVYLKKGANVKDVSEEIVETLAEKGSMQSLGKYTYVDFGEIMDGISNILDNITLFIALIGGISLFIAGIGMMNMMFISVSERTKEIGIRRALGATKKNIKLQFLLEGTVITVIGGILGYFFGLIMAMVIAIFLPFKVSIQPGPVLVSLLISLLIGIIFSYSPAKSAANKNVIEILV